MSHAWNLPEDVQALFHYFHTKAAALFLVGGAVRDFLQGLEPVDYDFAVNVPPDDLVRLLQDSSYELYRQGERFGTIGVLIGGKNYEITSFRKEDRYLDHRHPDVIHFTPSLEEDLARRDFTINAMAWSPTTGLVDPYGGLADLRSLKIRAVGDPRERMAEDALRILRALRFAAVLEAEIMPETAKAMEAFESTIAALPGERIGEELLKLFLSKRALKTLARYPWAWTRSLEAVGSEAASLNLASYCELDPVVSVVYVMLSTPGLLQDFNVAELPRIAVLEGLASIYRRSDREDLRVLSGLLRDHLSLADVEGVMRAWAWPEDIRRSVLLTLVDYALASHVRSLDITLAAILFTPERFKRLVRLLSLSGEDEPTFSVLDVEKLRETLPLDQADLGWSADKLIAEGYRGEEIRHQRTKGLLRKWLEDL